MEKSWVTDVFGKEQGEIVGTKHNKKLTKESVLASKVRIIRRAAESDSVKTQK